MPQPPPLPVPPPRHPFLFHGNAREFFRIWIVNTLLTLLTAGLFLAWAKVRKRRYLRGCTELMGHRFDYRARPSRILIGNLIVLVFFLGYALFGVVYPIIRYGVLGAGVLFLPWIVVRSLSFNAHNTAYRGMRFRFTSQVSAAAFVYLLEPVLIVITLGIYYPAWVRSVRRYQVDHHRLGDGFFRFDVPNRQYYRAYILGALITLAGVLVGGMLVAVLIGATQNRQPGLLALLPFLACYGAGAFLGKHFIYGSLFNQIWNGTRLDQHRFVASMRTERWIGLQAVNLGAILITGGLLYPWAVIRSQPYVASCLTFLPAGDIDGIERMGEKDGSGVGDSAGEFVGLDFGL
ncbi:MAG: YjgN family protein [Opitutaceae bacterium]